MRKKRASCNVADLERVESNEESRSNPANEILSPDMSSVVSGVSSRLFKSN